MITAINIETSLWDRIISLMKSHNWVESYRYDNFDARLDFDFVVLVKDGEEVLLVGTIGLKEKFNVQNNGCRQ